MIHAAAPHPTSRRDRVPLYALEFRVVTLIVFIGGHLCIALANQLGVHKQAVYVDIGEQSAVFVAALLAVLQTHRLARDQAAVGLKGFLTTIFRQFVGVARFGGIEAGMAYCMQFYL